MPKHLDSLWRFWKMYRHSSVTGFRISKLYPYFYVQPSALCVKILEISSVVEFSTKKLLRTNFWRRLKMVYKCTLKGLYFRCFIRNFQKMFRGLFFKKCLLFSMPPLQQPRNQAAFSQAAILVLLVTLCSKLRLTV